VAKAGKRREYKFRVDGQEILWADAEGGKVAGLVRLDQNVCLCRQRNESISSPCRFQVQDGTPLVGVPDCEVQRHSLTILVA
jgi:hypothetical protein